MPSEQNGPVAGSAAIRAGYQVAGRRFDTANHAPAQPVYPIAGARLRGFRSLSEGALLGFADIEPGGLSVHDCPVLREDGSAWTALPADLDGKQRADANGNRQFAPMLECRNRELGNRSASVVIALIERARSNVLGGSDG